MNYLKKSGITLSLVLLILMSVLPLAADGGHSEPANVETSPFSNTTLFLLSIGLGIVVAGGRQMIGGAKLKVAQLAILALGVMTAILHLAVGMRGEVLMLLNGLGYLGLLGLLYLPINIVPSNWLQPLHWLVLGYTIVTLAGYFVLHPLGEYSRFGLATKAIELLLIVAIGMRIKQVSGGKAVQYSTRQRATSK